VGSLTLFGFDPGGTTGFAHVVVEDRIFTPKLVNHLTPRQVMDWCEKMMDAEPFRVAIICEEYIINPRTYKYDHQGDKGIPMRLIGMLQLTADVIGADFHLQMPTAKPAGYGWLGGKYQRGKAGQHGIDALAHVMWFCVQRRIVDITLPQTAPSSPSQKPSVRRKSQTVHSTKLHGIDKEFGPDNESTVS